MCILNFEIFEEGRELDSIFTSNCMFGSAIWDKLLEYISKNFEILKMTRLIYPNNCPNQTGGYFLIKPNQQTLCIETNIF